MPETKEVALEDMDILFGVLGFAWQQRKRADIIIADRRHQLQTENIIIAGKDTPIHLETAKGESDV